MKIPNPWPNQSHVRFNVNDGECTGSCGPGPEIEVPDTAAVVLIEPVDRGTYASNPLAPGRIWSEAFGMLDAEDHWKKVRIKKEEQTLKVRQEAERLRKQNEAKAAVAQKEEPKVVMVDVDRAASGLAKVTKALKPKK